MGFLLKLGLLISTVQGAFVKNIHFSSSEAQTTLIELYSSEGCSSCPSADQFLSQFTDSDKLWTHYIPMAFHVDYWDYLGWKDIYAAPEFSDRQREHHRQGNLSSVYTPGFVVNGKEWAGFFKPWRSLPEFNDKPGELKVSIDQHQVRIEFPAATETLNYNLAIVGMGLITSVKSGENGGHDLVHDFVVLDHQNHIGKASISINLPLIIKHNPEQFAVIAWVTALDSFKPIQAVGGLLPNGVIKK